MTPSSFSTHSLPVAAIPMTAKPTANSKWDALCDAAECAALTPQERCDLRLFRLLYVGNKLSKGALGQISASNTRDYYALKELILAEYGYLQTGGSYCRFDGKRPLYLHFYHVAGHDFSFHCYNEPRNSQGITPMQSPAVRRRYPRYRALPSCYQCWTMVEVLEQLRRCHFMPITMLEASVICSDGRKPRPLAAGRKPVKLLGTESLTVRLNSCEQKQSPV